MGDEIWGVVGLAALSLAGLWGTHRANRRKRLLHVLPTSRTQGVFVGFVELKGTAESEVPLTSWLSSRICVLYSWSVQEHWRRTVQETYRDQQGNTRTRTRVESGWTTVDSGGEMQPFYLKDDTGCVLVRPEGADIRQVTFLSETCGPSHPLYYGRGPAGAIMNSTHDRRFVETGIPLHEELFIVGQARERSDIVAPEIAAHKAAPMYLVTAESEEQVLKRLGFSQGAWWFVSGAAAGGAGWLAAELPGCLMALAAWVLLWGLGWVITVFNSLIDSRNRMRQGLSLLDVQLQRRHDLIPPLVSVVQGLSAHESDVQETIAALRGQQSATHPGQPGTDFHGMAGRIQILAEKYPVLRTDDAFAGLQHQLIETEQRIALARAYFNDVASAWNTRIELFPDSILASFARFRRQPLLEAEEFERARVDVKLAEG